MKAEKQATNEDPERDAIISSIAEMAPFDVSPRGIRFRPSGKLKLALNRIIARGDFAVPGLETYLRQTEDPYQAIVWLYLLKKIKTNISESAVKDFLNHMKRENLWVGQFPGQREIRLFVGDEGAG